MHYREATLHIEIAMQTHPEPLFLADDGTYVDVTNFVRFELQHGDIRYGVLDLIVHFIYRGRRAQCYLLHFFPVDAVKENVNTPFPEWTEGFEFPPALLKLRATVEGAIIPLYHQGCIAINTRGATTYGAKRTRLRRMILHIQHHESHLLTVLAELVSVRVLTENTDPLDIFLQTRPFSGSLPRRVGFWTTTDRQQQQGLRVDTQPTEQVPPQRQTERTHHQIESALHARVQGLHALVQEIEQTVDYLPQDVQGALLTPLADLHSQLCGLVYVAWLLSLLHPHADDHDQ